MLEKAQRRTKHSSTFNFPFFKPLGSGFPRRRDSAVKLSIFVWLSWTSNLLCFGRARGHSWSARRGRRLCCVSSFVSGLRRLALFVLNAHCFFKCQSIEFFKYIFAPQNCVHQTLVPLRQSEKRLTASRRKCRDLAEPASLKDCAYLVLVLQDVANGLHDEEQILRVIWRFQKVRSARESPHETHKTDAALPAKRLAKGRNVADDCRQAIYQSRSRWRGA